jgi:hypothetical protein
MKRKQLISGKPRPVGGELHFAGSNAPHFLLLNHVPGCSRPMISCKIISIYSSFTSRQLYPIHKSYFL